VTGSSKSVTDIDALIAAGQQAEQFVDLGSGFTEGPAWSGERNLLVFSNGFTNSVHGWSEERGLTTLRDSSGQTNGTAWDLDGGLLCCESGARRLTRWHLDGSLQTVADKFGQHELNSPNDVICAQNGDIFFTDPPFGIHNDDGSYGPSPYGFGGVFRIDAKSNEISVVTDRLQFPNGLALSPNEDLLYVADSSGAKIWVFERHADGSFGRGRALVDVTESIGLCLPDGLRVDQSGRIFLAANTRHGVIVFDSTGSYVGSIPLVADPSTDPPEPRDGDDVEQANMLALISRPNFMNDIARPSNITFGGSDYSELLVTARSAVFRVRLTTSGLPRR